MEKIFSVDEAAEALKVSPYTVRAWIYSGKLSVVKLGRRTLLTERELDMFIAEGIRNGRNVARC